MEPARTASPSCGQSPTPDAMAFQTFSDGAAAGYENSEIPAAAPAAPAPEAAAGVGEFAEDDTVPVPAPPQDVKEMVRNALVSTQALVVSSYKGLRSWREFGDKSKFNAPTKMEAFSRAKINLVYFKSNYSVLILLLGVWTILSNLAFTISMCVTALAWKIYLGLSDNGKRSVILPGGRALSPLEGYSGLSLTTLLLFYITGGSSTIFWLIASAMIVILGHATMREAAATATELALETLSATGEPVPTNWV
eukprot:TRINITY_DN22581_c0_g1_i1.p1 TRINITY_DN22581_c0_g1~~TRINITY_DN22581_c0_g1_i1.p1  ORF type:complete len:251 (+),score=80.68 TRINITY_DN22581_c0_g1_i1:59-811(+)